MRSEDRKVAVKAYKERRIVRGLDAGHCASSGEGRIGAASALSGIRNRLRFTIRQGVNTRRSLLAAWKAIGAEAVTFEIVERFDEAEINYVPDRVMKERIAHWTGKFQAVRI